MKTEITQNNLPSAEHLYQTLLAQIKAAHMTVLAELAASPNLAQKKLHVVGIHSGGVWIARRLAQDLNLGKAGEIDVSLHRDDFEARGMHSQPKTTLLDFDVNGAQIILVDDVLYTGRTVRAAINELYDYGRPARIELAALLDRGGRELPIAASFCADTVQVSAKHILALNQSEQSSFSFSLEPAHT